MTSGIAQDAPSETAPPLLPAGVPARLDEAWLAEHVFPLFSRVLARGWSPENPDTEIYLANHSLGRPLDRTAEDVRAALDAWYADLDEAWGFWLAERANFQRRWARIIGCAEPGCIVPKTSAGQGVRAVLNAIPKNCPKVVATRGEFDSADFILKTYAARGRAEVVWVDPDEHGVFHTEQIAAAIERERPDVAVVSLVFFVTGQVLDGPDRVIEACRRVGALSLLDVYHAGGALEIGFDRLGPDFAVGGSYKYARGGPGACWLAVHPRHLRGEPTPVTPEGLATLDTGWFAKHDVFGFGRTDGPVLAPGGDAWQEATPPVLTWFQAKAGLELADALGVERIRTHSLERQAFLSDELEARGVRVETLGLPPRRRGAYLLLEVADPKTSIAQLREHGVAADARRCPTTGRAYARLCPDLLTTREEMTEAARRIADALA